MEQLTLPITLLLFALSIDIYVALLAWRRRRIPGGRILFHLMIAIAIWTGFAILEILTDSLPLDIFFAQCAYIGSETAPVFFLLLILSFSGEKYRLKSQTIPLLFVVPIITIILAFTNKYHELIWTSFTPLADTPNIFIFGHGPLYWVTAIGYSYICLLLGAIIILESIHKRQYTYRWQAISLFIGTILPWLGNVMYITKINPFPGIDCSPIAFSLVGIIVAFSIFRFRLLDISPVARDVLFENMVDSLIVLDPKERIIDINPAGLRMINTQYKECIGVPAYKILNTEFNDLLRNDQILTHESEIIWGENSEKTLDVTLIPVKDKNNKISGRLLVCKDVTEKQALEVELQQANITLQRQIDEIRKLQATLQEQAIRDPLTGIYNRRVLDDMLSLQIGQAKRDKTSISLVMIDLDNFKLFNDTYGHSAGDEALKTLAGILKTRTRQGDFACRYGGEEFLVVMPGATLSAGIKRANEWRVEFQNTSINYDGYLLNKTFSAGVATFPLHAISMDGLIKAADKGLYLAKNLGRNSVASIEINSNNVPQYHDTQKILLEKDLE